MRWHNSNESTNIRRERRRNEGSPLATVGKWRIRKLERCTDDFDLCMVKGTVINFYGENKIFPSFTVTMQGQLKKYIIRTVSFLML